MVNFGIASHWNPNPLVGPPRRLRFRGGRQVVGARERRAHPQTKPETVRCGGNRTGLGLLVRALVSGLLFVATVTVAGRAESAEVPAGVMTLGSGDTVPGTFRPSESSDVVRWQGTAFTKPFEFETRTVW